MALFASEFEQAMSQALADFNAGRLPQTEAACLRLLQDDGDNPAVHQLLAVSLFQRRQTGPARQHILLSLARRPDHVASLLLAGKIACANGAAAVAVPHFERAAALAPDAAEPAFLLGATLAQLRHPAAIAALQRLLLRHPAHAGGWCALGLALKHADDAHAALQAFERAVDSDAGMAPAHFHRANILQKLGQSTAAILSYRAARRLDPAAMEVAFNLGVALHQAGELDEARAMLESAVALAPAFADAWFSLGLVRQDMRELAGAADAFRTALRHRPDYAEAAVNLGIVLQESAAMEEAMDAYRLAVRLRPDTFSRIAQALTAASSGMLFLDMNALRRNLLI
ncbi:MAG TPA: hypothetical protein DCW29_01315 [Janthinobacterium sp.]|nr:hypothetical protein [Janthinobacterium sp.]